MNFRSSSYRRPQVTVAHEFIRAKIPALYENLRVIKASDEEIFEDVFVSALLPNNHRIKVKKNVLVFLND